MPAPSASDIYTISVVPSILTIIHYSNIIGFNYLRIFILFLVSIVIYQNMPKAKKQSKTEEFLGLQTHQLIYYDFETTGLNMFHDRVIEYAFMKENSDKNPAENVHYIKSLVNPHTKFEEIITKITGIHPQELENLPGIDNHSNKIVDFLRIPNGCIPYLVAHNGAGFDDFFLKRILFENSPGIYAEVKKNLRFIDTIHLAKKIARTKHHRRFSLKALAEHYKIKEGTHRALSDVTTLREVYKALIRDLSLELGMEFEDVLNDPEGVYNWLYDFN